jgi:adhesin/invasin
LINGTPAPLVYVSPTNIAVVVPAAIHPDTGFPDDAPWATFQVVNNGVRSNSAMVRAAFASPGIFTTAANGTGEAAVLHAADYSRVNASSPAVAGETVLIYLTGLGLVTPAVPDGAAASADPVSETNSPAYVLIDNQLAKASFVGLAPGYAGLYQVNAVVPQTPDSGDVSLDVYVESVAFAFQATIPVAANSSSASGVSSPAPAGKKMGPR